MAYDENLVDRIREILSEHRNVEEKKMMGGICFMVNEKMCVGILKDELMARIDPTIYESALELNGCREMNFTGKPMKGYIYVNEEGIETQKDLTYWIQLCVDFNPIAKRSKK